MQCAFEWLGSGEVEARSVGSRSNPLKSVSRDFEGGNLESGMRVQMREVDLNVSWALDKL